MADGAPIDYSYSPSGSTLELIDLASTHHSSRRSSRISSTGSNPSWHPKLTLYRLLVILSTIGLAIAKTVTSYLNLTFVSITIEWILGVVVFLFFYLLGAYEETRNPRLSWLFNCDYMEYLWAILENLTGFNRPYYISDEIQHQAAGIHPLLTGYRIIVTAVVAGVGMTKSALLYGQRSTEATAVECMFGVGIVTGLYLLGLYEASSTKVYPKLFHTDYSSEISYVTETVVVLLHLIALLICIALSYGCYSYATWAIVPASWNGEKKIDGISVSILVGGISITMSLGAAGGGFALMCHLLWRYRASPLGQFITRLPIVRLIPYAHRKYWLPTGTSLRPRPRFFYLKRLIIRQIVKIPLNLLFLYIIIMMFMSSVALSLGWYSVLMSLLEESPWYGLLYFFFISLFAVPSIVGWGVIAIHVGYNGVVSHFSEAWNDFTVDVEPLNASPHPEV